MPQFEIEHISIARVRYIHSDETAKGKEGQFL